jgi:hypothetical protein
LRGHTSAGKLCEHHRQVKAYVVSDQNGRCVDLHIQVEFSQDLLQCPPFGSRPLVRDPVDTDGIGRDYEPLWPNDVVLVPHQLLRRTKERPAVPRNYGPTWLSMSNVVATTAGDGHSLALTAEGQVVAWGSYCCNYDREPVPVTVPSGLSNVVAIAAGRGHSLALLQQPTVPTPRLTLSRGLSGLELQAEGVPGISCQLLRASGLPGPWLPTGPVTFTKDLQWLRAPDASEPAQFFRLLRK